MFALFEWLLLLPAAVLGFFLCVPAIGTVLSRLFPEPKPAAQGKNTDIACIITVYRNLPIAKPLVASLLAQTHRNFHIYLVADRLEGTPDWDIAHTQLNLILPEQPLNSKVRSIHLAIDSFQREHDAILIYDPDNLAEWHALEVLDRYFAAGYAAVQGKRTAKNLDTVYANLDALGEYYYDFSARQAPFGAGSSSTLAGSGMAVRTDLYRDYMRIPAMDASNGRVILAEDKILQQYLVARGFRIAYANDAICFDEKVATADAVERQRTRWMKTYFEHMFDGLQLLGQGLVRLSWNRIYYALITLIPPMSLLTAGSFTLGLLGLLLDLRITLLCWGGLAVFAANFGLALLFNRAPASVWQAVLNIPLFLSRQVLAMLRMQAAKNDFLATTHQHATTIDEVWEQRKGHFKPRWF